MTKFVMYYAVCRLFEVVIGQLIKGATRDERQRN